MQNLLALANEFSPSPVTGGIAMLRLARGNVWEKGKAGVGMRFRGTCS